MENEFSTTEIKVLNFLIHNNGLDRFYVTEEVIQLQFDLTPNMAKHCLENLLNFNLAKLDTIFSDAKYYKITEQGRLYLEKRSHNLKSKIVWSIIVPIAVSAITSLIITLLSLN